MRAKRSLGQNFLTSSDVVKDIIRASDIKDSDTVLEIGPGKGKLTHALLKTDVDVVAVEKDDELYKGLTERFEQEIVSGQFTLIHGDILELPISTLVADDYKVVANIPYNITGAIIKRFLESETPPNSMILMVQKEVGERVILKDGKHSILSVSVHVFGTPKIERNVSRNLFSPVPNVDSVVLSIKDISHKNFEGRNIEQFFELVKLGFAHKRKQLKGNLSDVFDKAQLSKAIERIGVPETVRAEDLSVEQWLSLYDNLCL